MMRIKFNTLQQDFNQSIIYSASWIGQVVFRGIWKFKIYEKLYFMSEIIPPRAYTNEPDIPLALWKHEKDDRGVAQNVSIADSFF